MSESINLSPLPFMIGIGLILVWQALGSIGAEYYLLHWIGTPWRSSPAVPQRVEAEPTQALMVWADEGGA